MLAIILGYLAGMLTIASPCILPILPFIFSHSGQSFKRSGLPMLAGMALTFTAFASLAAVSGEWTIAANQYGRTLALAFMALFALTLLFPQLAERIFRPWVAAGNRLLNTSAVGEQKGIGGALLSGVATGLLWTPCAGPILGLVLTGAAIQGANIGSSFLLLSYAAGAATSLALVLLTGNKVLLAMKKSSGNVSGLRRVLGGLMLVGVLAISLGLDRGVLARVSLLPTAPIEEQLLQKLGTPELPKIKETKAALTPIKEELPVLKDQGEMPPLTGVVQWLNSPPLTPQELRGKVVLVHFWTFGCINCQRSLPYVNAWAKKYREQGLVVIGIHSPEFAFEKDPASVKKEAAKLGIDYPIAIDNNFTVWNAYKNNYWPAHYFIDAKGHIRYMHIGEGDYAQSERVIQELLSEAGSKV
ncbi:cytochrome c biogenesis protein DipZ [Rahnella woolbedingensis]|uniref:Cytochrome c biogenesis protein DipZ n=1 Tax=Rahnella woolbedingensis TaxID=1510574 RepID=A0A419NDR3_9GAMM|nr:cytochrome c biogenesis protein DipZ [Rahnella woolbedingensis]RJT46742.1 cytochrome c biogenesis protein DipZ [Rahnella woolbedingensis]